MGTNRVEALLQEGRLWDSPVAVFGAAVSVGRSLTGLEGIATTESILRNDQITAALEVIAVAKALLAAPVTVP